VHVVRGEVSATGDALDLRYVLEGDLTGLALAPLAASRRVDGLWRHTCFEAFVAGTEANEYVELNFSPSTEWAIYRFSAYRAGRVAVETARPPRIVVHNEGACLSLQATVECGLLGGLCNAPALRMALAAVVEQADGRLSYWALAHPPGQPDFHHAAGFALEVRAAAADRLAR